MGRRMASLGGTAMRRPQEAGVSGKSWRRSARYIAGAMVGLVGGLAVTVASSSAQHRTQPALPNSPTGAIHEVVSGGRLTLSGQLPTPPWWNGFCDDVTYHNATGLHTHQLGTATYLGMVACGPRPIGNGAPDVQVCFTGSGCSSASFHLPNYRPEWECTELAARWMYMAWGVPPYNATGSTQVKSYFDVFPSNPYHLVREYNGTSGQAPQPGDVLSWGSVNIAGHTAVVTAVDPSVTTSGTGTISIIEENSAALGVGTIYDSGWKVTDPQGNGPGPISGWLHNPGVAAPETAGPSVAVWPNSPGQQDVFWKGADGNLWEGVWNNGWHGPTDIKNTKTGQQMGPLGSEPTVAVNPARGEEDVFWKGTDGALWEAYWSSCCGGWIGPSKVPNTGQLGSQPSVAVWPNSPGEQDIFWTGTDGNLWADTWNNGWHGPIEIKNTKTGQQMGPLGSVPTAHTNPARDEEDVFWRGTDGALWEAYWSGCCGGWVGPNKVPNTGQLGSQPSLAVWPSSPGEQDIFWTGTDGNLWAETWNNGWHGPTDIKNAKTGQQMGPLGSAPTAATNPARDEVDVFWKGTDANLWQAYWAGCCGGWTGPGKVGMGPLG